MKTATQREFARWGNVTVDAVFDAGGRMRCPFCGNRFRFSISRRPIEKNGSHRVSGTCDCGKVKVTGYFGALFETVPGMEDDVA